MMLQTLKTYCEAGLSCHLLRVRSKAPLHKNWAARPTWKFDDLKRHFHEGMNIGVRFGSPTKFQDGSTLLAFDVDVKGTEERHFAQAMKALSEYVGGDIDHLPKVISGRGGGSCHLYFRWNGKTIPRNRKIARSDETVRVKMPSVQRSKKEEELWSKGKLKKNERLRPAWEVELMSSGKQAVLPPSVHPDTKKTYEWEKHTPSTFRDFPLLSFDLKGGLNEVISKEHDIEFEPVEIELCGLSDRMLALIKEGEGIDEDYGGDRSSAVYAAIIAMMGVGLSDSEIASVCVDADYAISDAALSRRGSRESAIDWIVPQIRKARAQFGPASEFEIIDSIPEKKNLTEEEIKQIEEEAALWWDQLSVTKTGAVRNTTRNRDIIFQNDVNLVGVFQWNEFTRSVWMMNKPEWASAKECPKEMDDNDLIDLAGYFGAEFCDVSTASLYETVVRAGNKAPFHPVVDYLEGLRWDGIKRLDNWLHEFLGCDNSEYAACIGRKTLIAMVARVYEPGCKFDNLLVLEGDQGTGKSTALNILAGEWYADFSGDIESKDVIQVMFSKWLIEMGEMHATTKADIRAIKGFLSRQVDRDRLAYARIAKDFPRQCVWVGTTNESHYLKDDSGNRRFWPIKTGEIDLKGLQGARDQLFAEAREAFNQGESLNMPRELWAKAKEEQDARFDHDPKTDMILDWLESDEFGRARKGVRTMDIWAECFGKDPASMSKRESNNIGQILRANGWERDRWRDGKGGWVRGFRKMEKIEGWEDILQ